MFHPDPAYKLSANLYDIYHLAHLVGFVIRICHDAWSHERKKYRIRSLLEATCPINSKDRVCNYLFL